MAERYPGGFSPACVDAAAIAAFVDGTIDPAGRARVVAHLATCPDCSELVGEVVRTDDELPVAESRRDPSPADPRGTVLWMRRRGLAAVGGVVAIAASVLLFVLGRGAPLDPLVAAVGNERLTLARPTGGFHYGPLQSPVRGANTGASQLLLAAVSRLRERARATNAAGDLHAEGVALLVAGQTADAIASLQSAARARPDDAAIAADLGAGYLTRFVERGEQGDAAAALESFDRALARSPALEEAWFNKALLLERMNRLDEALTAWNRAVELAGDSGWRGEAVRQRDDVQRRLR